MTLLDWFAGMALTAMLCTPGGTTGRSSADVAADCHDYARAMLREKAKRETP